MAERTPRQVIEAYADAMNRADWDLLRDVLADDYVEDYPQSGERVRGREHAIAVRNRGRPQNSPGDLDRRPELVIGGEERWALAPNFTAIKTTAADDTVTSVVRARYPDGEWYVVYIGTIEAGRIRRATMVFGPLFEAPEWRRALTERMPDRDR